MSDVMNEALTVPLTDMIRDIGLAVADANKALAEGHEAGVIYTIPDAEVEVSLAMSSTKARSLEVGGGGTVYAVALNASYTNSFGFSESAASKVRLTLRAVPKRAPTGGGTP